MRKAIAAFYLLGTIVLFASTSSNLTLAASSKTVASGTHFGQPERPPCFPCSGDSRKAR